MIIPLAIMGVTLFMLILAGYFMIIKFSPVCPDTAYLVFYIITMSLLSLAMMRMTV